MTDLLDPLHASSSAWARFFAELYLHGCSGTVANDNAVPPLFRGPPGGRRAALTEPPRAPTALAREGHVLLLECAVAGTSFHDLATVWDDIVVGDPLVLDRDPDNRHDARAVRVLARGGVMLGYVPRAKNEAVAALLDAGKNLSATITAGRRSRDGGSVKMGIYLQRA